MYIVTGSQICRGLTISQQYAEDIGVAYETLRRYWSVAAAYEYGSRLPDLSWSHHRDAVASPDRDSLPAQAAEEGWSTRG
jgi:hypothetical protein